MRGCPGFPSTRYTYDPLGRVLTSAQTTDANGTFNTFNFSYTYRLDGALRTQQSPSGRAVAFDYDFAGRPIKAGLGLTPGTTDYLQSILYAPHGAPKQVQMGSGLLETTLFNTRLQPSTIQAGGLLTLNFDYDTTGTDNNGNVRSQEIIAPGLPATLTQTYTYDQVNRLSSVTETGGATNWNRAYAYDAFGNRAATGADVFVNTPQNLGTFNTATNRLTASFASYDLAGNQTVFNTPGYEATLSYDANNLQRYYCAGAVAPCSDATASAKYYYDGQGRRVKKQQGTAKTTLFVYDAFGNLAAEYDTQPDANLVAGRYFRTTDHLGSTRLVTDANQAVVSRRDFFPFGEQITANATFGNRHLVTDGAYNQEFGVYQKFTGKERDTESGLDYFGARYFGSSLGRFTSPDAPFADQFAENPQSWNLYNYVRNNPLRFIDPNGEYVASCNSDVKGCQKEIEAVENARQQALKSKDSSVRRAAEAYGDLGDDNGVSVTIAKTVDPKHKSVAGQVGAQQGTGGFTVDAEGNIKQATAVTLKAGLSGNTLTGTVIHEGSHVADRADFVNSIHRDPQSVFGFSYDPALNITRGQSEINAYSIENIFLRSVGLPQRNIKRILSRPPYSTTDLSLPLFPALRVQP